MKRLNVGSGQRPFGAGWTNIDCQAKWSPDIVAEADDIPLPDGCADIVVLHHVLEHFGLGEADNSIKELKRLLCPGGSLIITVPDIERLFEGHRRGAIDDWILMINLYGAYMGDEADRHKWGFTPRSLREWLVKFEWQDVREFDFRPIEGGNIAQDWWILGMEAIK